MKIKKWKPYILWVAISELSGILAALLTLEGGRIYEDTVVKPPLTPPAIVFPIVWTVLYGLMGISAGRIWALPGSKERDWAINLFVIQLILNFFWTLIFFNARAFGVASVWIVILWIAVLAMILQFKKMDLTAAWLQIPYLVWLTFASLLTFGVWIYNG